MEVLRGDCQCGCGGKTTVPLKSCTRDNRIKGEPLLYITGHHNKGKTNPNWKGGRYINDQGYVWIREPSHPRANNWGYVREHILVMEKSLGRYIVYPEAVHHIDEDRANNNIGNLMLFKDQKMHLAYHLRLKAFAVCGNYEWRKCSLCHQYDDPQKLSLRSNHNCVHKSCEAKYAREARKRRKAA